MLALVNGATTMNVTKAERRRLEALRDDATRAALVCVCGGVSRISREVSSRYDVLSILLLRSRIIDGS